MKPLSRWAITCMGCALLAGACTNSAGMLQPGDPCTVYRLYATISPDSAALAVGDTVTFTAARTANQPCSSSDITPANFRWYVLDTSVANIDSLTGHLVAKIPGTTFVELGTARADLNSAKIEVH